MNRECRIKEEIKNHWFKNHIATLKDYGELKVLDWKAPGTIVYYCRFVFDGNKMYVSGDIGEAVFNLTWEADVHSFDGISTSYFMEKMAAYSDDRYDFDSEEAVKALQEWKEQLLEDREFENDFERECFMNDINELIGAASNCNSEDEWARGCVNNEYYDFISENDPDYWEWIYNIGRVIPHRVYGYIVALQMASEQLKGIKI